MLHDDDILGNTFEKEIEGLIKEVILPPGEKFSEHLLDLVNICSFDQLRKYQSEIVAHFRHFLNLKDNLLFGGTMCAVYITSIA